MRSSVRRRRGPEGPIVGKVPRLISARRRDGSRDRIAERGARSHRKRREKRRTRIGLPRPPARSAICGRCPMIKGNNGADVVELIGPMTSAR